MHKLMQPQEPTDFTSGVAVVKGNHPHATPNQLWEAFRNEQPEAYDAARIQLGKNQSGLCAYCEIELRKNNQQIEHIMPKSKSSSPEDHTLDFANLLLCCKGGTNKYTPHTDEYLPNLSKHANRSCGEKKGDLSPVDSFISPYQLPENPVFLLYHHPDGEVSFAVDRDACKQASIDPEKIENTINMLGLNCPRLKRNRQEICGDIQEEIDDLPAAERDKALLALAEAHLTPRNGILPAYITTRFLYLLPDFSRQQLLDIAQW